MNDFARTYAQAICDAAKDVAHWDAFRGKTFAVDEHGDVFQVTEHPGSLDQQHLAWFLQDELENKLSNTDFSTVHFGTNDDVAVDFAVNAFLYTTISFCDRARVHIGCTDYQGLERYMNDAVDANRE